MDKAKQVVTEVAQEPIVDEDYQFRLESRDNTWKVMDEKEFGMLLPDAVAGAVSGSGTYGAIIVESLPSTNLDSFSELIQNNTEELMRTKTGAVESTNFKGLPARTFSTNATLNGAQIYYRHTLVKRGEFGFQLVSWSLKPNEASFDEFLAMVTFLDGKLKHREIDTSIPDYNGPAQRVRDGDFVSPVYGISATKVKGWKTLVGQGLSLISSDAIVGFESANGIGYGSVIAEFLDVDDFTKFAVEAEAIFRDALGASRTSREPIVLHALGTDVPMHEYQTEGTPKVAFYYGVTQVQTPNGSMIVQLQFWSSLDPGEAWEHLRVPASQLSIVDASELKELQREYHELPDAQNSVGSNDCVRRGVYRNFDVGVTWQKPKQGVWLIKSGDEATAEVADVSLVVSDIVSGIYATITLGVDVAGLSEAEYHDTVLQSYGKDGTAKPDLVAIDGRDCLSSSIQLPSEGSVGYEQVLTTTIIQGRGVEIIIAGTPQVMQANKPLLDGFHNGFRFPGAKLRSLVENGSIVRDERMGFEFQRKPEWKLVDVTPQQIKALGSLYTLTSKDRSIAITFGGVATLDVGVTSGKFLQELVSGSMKAKLGAAFDLSDGTKSEILIDGTKGSMQSWNSKGISARAISVHRDSTLYLVIAIDERGGDEILQWSRDGLRLLD